MRQDGCWRLGEDATREGFSFSGLWILGSGCMKKENLDNIIWVRMVGLPLHL